MRVPRLPRRRTTAAIALAAVVIVAVGVTTVALGWGRGSGRRTISAVFAQAPGLYVGNHVQVLGMPVGQITSIKPGPGGVVIRLAVDKNVQIPADARAVLMAPQVINDRAVELTPAYTGGSTLPAGATIPLARTLEPLSVDQVLDSLDNLVKALGPAVANPQGALGSLINQLTRQLAGQGQNLHNTIGDTSGALSDLASDAPQMASTISQLSGIVGTLSADSQNYEAFAGNLAGAASQLDSQKQELATALSTLQATLGQVTAFVQRSGNALGSTVNSLDTAVQATNAQRQSLANALHLLPLVGQNLYQAVGKEYTFGANQPAIDARTNLTDNTQAFVHTLCGSILQRAGNIFTKQASATVLDAVCTFAADTTYFNHPAGEPQGPDLSMSALYAATRGSG